MTARRDTMPTGHYLTFTGGARWMSENLTGERAPRWGKPHTPETQARISATKRAQMYIGDSPVHDIEFGDIVCINGVNFKLTHFGQDYEEAMATLTPLKEVTQQETEPARVTYAQRMGTRTDYMGPRIHHNGTPWTWSPRG